MSLPTPYYQDDFCTIYHANCLDILPHLPVVDHVITDPPYGAHVHDKQWIGSALTACAKPRVSTAHKELGFACLSEQMQAFAARQFSRVARRWVAIFCDLEGLHGWKLAVESFGLDYVRACVWDKVDSAPQFTGDRPANSAELIVLAHPKGKKSWNGGGKRNVFRFAVNSVSGPKPHPSTKPLMLMTELINLFTDCGDTVLDPFMGSGTTLEAAKLMGRKAIGIELEERYCEIAANRLRQEVLL